MVIKRLAIERLAPGMITAGDIYGHGGLLVENGKALTESDIVTISEHGILYVPIREESIKEGMTRPRIFTEKKPNPNDLSAIRETSEYQIFAKKFDAAAKELKERLNEIIKDSKKIDIDALVGMVNELEECTDGPERLMDMLRCLRDYDDLTFVHSVNVSLIAGVCAKWLKLSEEGIRNVKLAGLLHDIGKMKLPQAIVQKPEKLTKEEFEIMKLHPTLGYQILKDGNIDNEVKMAALEHHEKCDRSGYPRQLGYDDITMTAKIITIADVYDAMTAARCYRAPMCPFDVIDIIFNDSYSKYEFGYVSKFMKNIAMTYRNRTVRLSDGSTGEIMFIGDNNPARPIIMTDNGLLDLASNPKLKIQAVL